MFYCLVACLRESTHTYNEYVFNKELMCSNVMLIDYCVFLVWSSDREMYTQRLLNIDIMCVCVSVRKQLRYDTVRSFVYRIGWFG